jgi:glutaconyl-CoA/methylmalonyl-CoA decarboxylase subunit gamma
MEGAGEDRESALMHYQVEVAGRTRQVNVQRVEGHFVVTVDGREHVVDARRVDGQTMSLLIDTVRLPASAKATAGPSEPRVDRSASGGETSNAATDGEVRPTADALGVSYTVTFATDPATKQLVLGIGAAAVPVSLNGRRRSGRKDEAAHGTGPQRIVAPMPGKVVKVLVSKGDTVRARQPLVVIEAMKMENELRATGAGAIAELHVQEGQSVDAGTLVALVGPA